MLAGHTQNLQSVLRAAFFSPSGADAPTATTANTISKVNKRIDRFNIMVKMWTSLVAVGWKSMESFNRKQKSDTRRFPSLLAAGLTCQCFFTSLNGFSDSTNSKEMS